MSEKKPTRIQTANREKIRAAALEIFARDGFRGATVDAIAGAAGMSKPNLLYYFPTKDQIYRSLLEGLLGAWLAPLREMRADGEPIREIGAYIERKIELARDYPMESRLFANEMLRGAPILSDVLAGELKPLVDEKAAVIRGWSRAGKLSEVDPHHLIFAIWATTQHYADFDPQVRVVLGRDDEARFHDAAAAIKRLFLDGLKPR
ncbi:TetR family transcriptional regulator C-terminal domain-containing protein [Rhodobacteraceae bacterium NNCM2]|nr:TetR family transcriptional regulator C-terminal domain-containing protein [Coraliihabitans acroporae]